MLNSIIEKIYSILIKFPVLEKCITVQFLRYFFVGITAFFITYSVNSILVLFLDYGISYPDNYRAVLISGAFVIAYISSFIYNYWLSKSWTFSTDKKGSKYQLYKFFIVHFTTLVLASLTISWLDAKGISPLISLPFLGFIQMCTGFLANKYWVFRVKV